VTFNHFNKEHAQWSSVGDPLRWW